MNYKHAKVVPAYSIKLTTVLMAMAAVTMGAVGVKAVVNGGDDLQPTAVEVVESNNCSKLFSGQSCRIEAAINEALGQ